EALEHTGDNVALFFVDDCCLSGTQAINTFEELLGVRKLKAHHTRLTNKLNDHQITKLKMREINLCFAVATSEGVRRLREKLSTMGFNKVQVHASQYEIVEQKIFSPYFSWVWRNRKEMESCKSFFKKVGCQILAVRASKKHWKPAR